MAASKSAQAGRGTAASDPSSSVDEEPPRLRGPDGRGRHRPPLLSWPEASWRSSCSWRRRPRPILSTTSSTGTTTRHSHPLKKRRPVASGRLSVNLALSAAAALARRSRLSQQPWDLELCLLWDRHRLSPRQRLLLARAEAGALGRAGLCGSGVRPPGGRGRGRPTFWPVQNHP